MAPMTEATWKIAHSLMTRATNRLNGAATAIAREDITEGEFDNHFDGVVSAIFHIADAVELVRTGIHRRFGEGEESTVIHSVIMKLVADKIDAVPAPTRLLDLNRRRNMSVHGLWSEILDTESLGDAITAGRQFYRAAQTYIERRETLPEQG